LNDEHVVAASCLADCPKIVRLRLHRMVVGLLLVLVFHELILCLLGPGMLVMEALRLVEVDAILFSSLIRHI